MRRLLAENHLRSFPPRRAPFLPQMVDSFSLYSGSDGSDKDSATMYRGPEGKGVEKLGGGLPVRHLPGDNNTTNHTERASTEEVVSQNFVFVVGSVTQLSTKGFS